MGLGKLLKATVGMPEIATAPLTVTGFGIDITVTLGSWPLIATTPSTLIGFGKLLMLTVGMPLMATAPLTVTGLGILITETVGIPEIFTVPCIGTEDWSEAITTGNEAEVVFCPTVGAMDPNHPEIFTDPSILLTSNSVAPTILTFWVAGKLVTETVGIPEMATAPLTVIGLGIELIVILGRPPLMATAPLTVKGLGKLVIVTTETPETLTTPLTANGCNGVPNTKSPFSFVILTGQPETKGAGEPWSFIASTKKPALVNPCDMLTQLRTVEIEG
jgi:hypothetical protein